MRKTILLFLMFLSLITACGGGGGDAGGSLSNNTTQNTTNNTNSNTTNSQVVKVDLFSMSQTDLTNTGSFKADWKVTWNPSNYYNNYYWVELHFNDKNEVTQGVTGLTRHYYLNCYPTAGLTCTGNGGTINCEIKQDITGKYYTLCSYDTRTASSHNFIFSGDGYVIFRACAYDTNMNTVCDSKSLQVKLP